jgi:hypothetical protein
MKPKTKAPVSSAKETSATTEVSKNKASVESKVKPIIAHERQTYDVDTEFNPVTDEPTTALTVQISTTVDTKIRTIVYQHPMTQVEYGDTPVFPYFCTPLALLDYEGLTTEGKDWRWNTERVKTTHTYAVDFFFALHDVGYLFADEKTYRRTILPNVRKPRRHM